MFPSKDPVGAMRRRCEPDGLNPVSFMPSGRKMCSAQYTSSGSPEMCLTNSPLIDFSAQQAIPTVRARRQEHQKNGDENPEQDEPPRTLRFALSNWWQPTHRLKSAGLDPEERTKLSCPQLPLRENRSHNTLPRLRFTKGLIDRRDCPQ